ncbi:MAG TPA: TIGR02281 family clan AA aspartic protease [Xanthobacteraceae bacterium]|nr:TIGR02281 family clan AA aspartic protease [Xanthobacteraceae bacterium]
MRPLAFFCVALLLFAGLAGELASRIGLDGPPAEQAPAPASPHAEAKPARGGSEILFVARDTGGHFGVDAVIGGQRVPFIVDTGASIVALTSETAARLDIAPALRGRRLRIQTANGIVEADSVRLASIRVGPLEVQDVEAVIVPRGRLGQNLLGMSFLSRLTRYEFRSGSLVMEQ